MMDAVHRYEGYVAQSLGDGIFALFGAPIAHEDYAQRALYAALCMQEEMRRSADRVRLARGVPLQIRVGLNTGAVVVRSIRTDDLQSQQQHRQGGRLPAPRRAAGGRALGLCRGERPLDHRLRPAHHPARDPRAQPAGVDRADDARPCVGGGQGLCSTRGGTELQPCPRAV
jgi:hypothetical protein